MPKTQKALYHDDRPAWYIELSKRSERLMVNSGAPGTSSSSYNCVKDPSSQEPRWTDLSPSMQTSRASTPARSPPPEKSSSSQNLSLVPDYGSPTSTSWTDKGCTTRDSGHGSAHNSRGNPRRRGGRPRKGADRDIQPLYNPKGRHEKKKRVARDGSLRYWCPWRTSSMLLNPTLE